ncbi:MAG TPA: CheR family methyltransferase, partial [Polyangia bacterium]|nr:CheR family methyltransferase [Polyangia bacterium]
MLPMSPQVFAILSALVAEHAGLHFDQDHASIFADKVAARAAGAGFDSLLDYYYFIRYDPGGRAELEALIEALVIGETYLFRELGPLEVAVSEFIMPALARGRRPRIWSSACATGEEPHTLAMVLADRGVLDDVDIVASDINRVSLARAQSGRYSARSVRGDVPAFGVPWLQVTDREITVSQRLTAAIDWRRVNLMDAAAVAELGTFDVILCRNVLIYFDEPVAGGVVGRLTERLRRGGALLVG